MANKIIFGADLIKVLEKEYKLNKLGEVPTKYKNGITTIDFIYGKEKDINDLKYDKPYVEFSIDDETDGFISGTMYLNGGVEGIQFDSWDDLKYFMKNAKWTESKKSTHKSMKENELFSSNTPYEIKVNGKKIKSHSDYEVVYDRVENDEYVLGIKIKGVGNTQLRFSSKNEAKELGWITESKKSIKKSLKESTDESFSLYDLNKHDPFVKEWIRNINKELHDVSIESIGDDEIVFRVWFDESIDLDIFDDIATDYMPRTLIEFMSDMNIDFGYQFVYADDKFTENDFVFIRFVAW